jgi:hypothetical protein
MSSVAPNSAVVLDDSVPRHVREFCSKNELTSHLPVVLHLARESFKPVDHLQVEPETDPDTDEKRVLIEVTIDATPEQAVEMKKTYTRNWVASAPTEIRQKIRLLYQFR